MPRSRLDLVYLVLAFGLPIAFELLITTRRMKAKASAGVPGIRPRTYRRTIGLQLALSLPIVVAWIVTGRPWSALGVTPPSGGRAVVSAAMIALTCGVGLMQVRGIKRIAASARKREKYRKGFANTAFMLPRDEHEYRWFAALSVTGGICEEFLYRGYMIWVLLAYMNFFAAVAVSASVFAVGHLYQGFRGALRTGLIAVGMNVMVWIGGWLLPAMFVHALLNATTGWLAYVAFQGAPGVCQTGAMEAVV